MTRGKWTVTSTYTLVDVCAISCHVAYMAMDRFSDNGSIDADAPNSPSWEQDTEMERREKTDYKLVSFHLFVVFLCLFVVSLRIFVVRFASL